jgi:hypothetical protein
MENRRVFIKQALRGSAALAAYGILPSSRVLGANDRIRFALIGGGDRGQEIFKAALKCPNVEAVAVADVYTRRLDQVKALVPTIKPYRDFRGLLDDKSIDAVLIATPQHMHALNFVPAIQAGKDIYQEKTMAFNPDHAKRMRKALEGSGRVVQVGIQSTSGAAVEQARALICPEKMGVITQLHTHHYRNEPYGGWKREIPADCTPENVDWKAFQGEAEPHPFDPNRVINWRFFWDYAGGNVYENMVHQVGFWYKVMNLTIAERVTMCGANYLAPEMQPPDTMDVCMIQKEKLVFTWNSMFGNRLIGEPKDHLLGTKGTIFRDERERVSYVPQDRHATGPAGAETAESKTPDIVGHGNANVVHMQNFFDCVRSRKEPNCPLELGFRAAVVCRMAVTSYREKRTVHWDEQFEEIV